MPKQNLVECSFLIPVRRDANLSDGKIHAPELWAWRDEELLDRFYGRTVAPGRYEGFYVDPDTQEKVSDESMRFVVAVERADLRDLRDLLSAACVEFQQK